MSINFPTSLDTLSNPSSGDTLSAVPHATQHADANDAIEALEAKVGINSSAVTTSHDYKLGEVTGTDKAVGKTATQTLTNKTLTSPIINLSSNATGDIYYRAADGTLARLPIGTTGNILDVSAGGLPEWTANPSATNASTTTAGIVEEATAAEAAAGTATGGTGARLFVNPSTLPKSFPVQDIAVVGGTTATNAGSGYYICSDPTSTALYAAVDLTGSGTCTIYRFQKDSTTGNIFLTHTTTLNTVTSNGVRGICANNAYVYVTASISGVNSLKRYDLADLANVTSMTFSGTSRAAQCFGDTSGNIYIYNGSAGQYDKFTISGTTATNSSTLTYTSGVGNSGACDGTSVWLFDGSVTIRKYPIAGGSATSSQAFYSGSPPNYVYKNYTNLQLFVANSDTVGVAFAYNNSDATALIGALIHAFAFKI